MDWSQKLETGDSDNALAHGQVKLSNRILVVDDDVGIRAVSVGVLTSFGYQVDTAGDGEAGWEALQTKNYDLLITDHNMPKISGVELIKRLRSARMTLPVVLASGTCPVETLTRNPQLQIAATLPKPFTVDELLGIVKKVLPGASLSAGDS